MFLVHIRKYRTKSPEILAAFRVPGTKKKLASNLVNLGRITQEVCAECSNDKQKPCAERLETIFDSGVGFVAGVTDCKQVSLGFENKLRGDHEC